MCISRIIVKLLIIVGALNWGLFGFFQYDLVAQIFGGADMTGARVVYSLIGIAGLVGLFCCIRSCCGCGGKCDCNCGCKACDKDKRK